MKNKTQVFILLLIMVTLTACRYDEGPMISFRSVEKRVAQSFLLVEFTKNGVDMTQELTDSCGIYWTFKTYRETGGDKNLILNPVQYNVLIGRYGISSNKV